MAEPRPAPLPSPATLAAESQKRKRCATRADTGDGGARRQPSDDGAEEAKRPLATARYLGGAHQTVLDFARSEADLIAHFELCMLELRGSPVSDIGELMSMHNCVETVLTEAALAMRRAEATWTEVGDAFGISPRRARTLFAELERDSRVRP